MIPNLAKFFIPFLFVLFIGSTKEEADQNKKPNMLFVILDDASMRHFSAYSSQWVNTPNFDRVAKNGILFNNAYTPNAKCGPSRSSILTGRNSWQLEAAANHLCFFPTKFKTVAESLSENGYEVAYTGKGWQPGVAEDENGNERDLLVRNVSSIRIKPPAKYIATVDYFANFKSFLDSSQTAKPFFFWLGLREPHRPYQYHAGIDLGGKKVSDVDQIYPMWPQNDTVAIDMLDYAYEIEYADSVIGQYLDELEKRGELDNTLIMVTSDNGMPFPRVKGQEYEISSHMPLAVMWGDGIANPGRTVDDIVSFIDFTPTFLELAGLSQKKSGMEPIQGKSLVNIFKSSKDGQINKDRDHLLFGKEKHDVGRPGDVGYPIRGILSDDYMFIQNFKTDRWPNGNPETGYLNCDGSPTKTLTLDARDNPETFKLWEWSFGKRPEYEFYNIKEDPFCINNLADDQMHKDRIVAMKEQLYAELKEQDDPRMFGNGDVFDSYPTSDIPGLPMRNFYERYMENPNIPHRWVQDSDFRPIKDD